MLTSGNPVILVADVVYFSLIVDLIPAGTCAVVKILVSTISYHCDSNIASRDSGQYSISAVPVQPRICVSR